MPEDDARFFMGHFIGQRVTHKRPIFDAFDTVGRYLIADFMCRYCRRATLRQCLSDQTRQGRADAREQGDGTFGGTGQAGDGAEMAQ